MDQAEHESVRVGPFNEVEFLASKYFASVPRAALRVYAVMRQEVRLSLDRKLVSRMTRKALCERTGLSKATIDRAIQWLVGEGWIVPERESGHPKGVFLIGRFGMAGEDYLADFVISSKEAACGDRDNLLTLP